MSTISSLLNSSKSALTSVVDSIIVGAGPAGLATSLFLGRSGLSVLTFDGGVSRIECVDLVREFLGWNGVRPQEMLHKMQQEATEYGVVVKKQFVDRIVPREDGLFDVQTHSLSTSGAATNTAKSNHIYTARTIVLATGLVDVLPQISGVPGPSPSTYGNDLRVCPCFDGYEVINQRFVVFGPDVPQRLPHLASWVSMWSDKVTLLSAAPLSSNDTEKLRCLHIRVIPEDVRGLIRNDSGKVIAVETSSGHRIDADACWVALKMKAASPLAAQLCTVDENGLARVDAQTKTSRAGVFAIGNASTAYAHVAHAVAEGTTAGPIVLNYLLEDKIKRAQSAGSPIATPSEITAEATMALSK